jgi:hypothetical protein
MRAIEAFQPTWAEIEEVSPCGSRLTSQSADVDSVAHFGKSLEQPDAVVELDGRAMEVSVLEQVVHADANLEDTFVQVADFARRRPPQQLDGFVLIEELAGVELVDPLDELRRSGRPARADQVSRCQAF